MTELAKNLGHLEQVELRKVWASESADFTPWLAKPENLVLLGDTVGLELELEAQEKNIGPFRADILCKDTTTDNWVLIENQLERTDHTHLGQLLTYAAGLSAVSIIWIAERFTEEHRAALDWLNEKTPENINFFGLEIELWRIGDSPVAPKFNVVCKPNEWTRSVIRSRDSSESNQFCQDYWSGVFDAIRPSGILRESAKPFCRHDTNVDVGWHTFMLKAYFSRPKKRGGVWVTCRGPRGFENYLKIKESQKEIEEKMGHALKWYGYEDKNHGSCLSPLNGFDVDNRNDWPRQHQLFAERLLALYRAVLPYVGPLDVVAKEVDER